MARSDRQQPDKPEGPRSPFQRDRDRLLYSSSFRRLTGVTQVVLSSGEPYLFHNRLVHSIKVAQVARRLAEYLLERHGSGAFEGLPGGGCDPDVVEAAALAHDLGHPPFGHVAEQELDACVRRTGDQDGFEGNAQTFRIITRLAAISDKSLGLNLTRATVAASCKYPWFSGEGETTKKWGAYHDDSSSFAWALDGLAPNERTLEAEIMDWADDISYAVHDLEDFYRAGLIPLDRFGNEVEPLDPLFDRLITNWAPHLGKPPTKEELALVGERLQSFPSSLPFTGKRHQRGVLRNYTSALVNDLITDTTLESGHIQPPRGAIITSELLKLLTWYYVIEASPLATQQVGQRRIIRAIYAIYLRCLQQKKPEILPTRWREEADEAMSAGGDVLPRLVADIIASLTEEEATAIFHRLTGTTTAFLDPRIG